MQGFQLKFYTQQDRMHGREPVAQWLLAEARRMGLRGATLSGAIEGLGHDRQVHTVNLFDLAEQPVQVTLVVSPEEAERLLTHLANEQVRLFYTRAPVTFGTTGEDV